MSQPTQSSIFKKSNLVYIPLTITVAHTLNFIVNSPLSTWQEFPPKLPESVYSSTFFTPLLLFISLTFEPIQTRKRFYTLLSLALILVSIPISYRGGIYPIHFHNQFVSIAMFCGLKMFLFLKLNRTYLNQKQSDQKKEFKSYFWTLFNWRFNSYIINPNSDDSPLIINSPTTLQVYKKIANRFVAIIAKWLMFELAFFTSTKFASDIPEKPYQVRLVEFITKGVPAFTMFSLLHCLNFTFFVFLCLSLSYDSLTIIIATIYRLFFHHSTSEKNNYKPILIKFGILTPSEYFSLSEWFVTFLFNTKHLFSEPWISSSPRDFWSNRWQLLLNEIFKGLGFLPIRNLFVPFVPKKIANMMGVLGAFGISALLHEYLMISSYNVWTGEQFFFFMMHGVLFVLWEAVFGYEKKDDNTIIKRFLKWVLLFTINLILLPALIEPTRRNFDASTIPSYFSKYYMD